MSRKLQSKREQAEEMAKQWMPRLEKEWQRVGVKLHGKKSVDIWSRTPSELCTLNLQASRQGHME